MKFNLPNDRDTSIILNTCSLSFLRLTADPISRQKLLTLLELNIWSSYFRQNMESSFLNESRLSFEIDFFRYCALFPAGKVRYISIFRKIWKLITLASSSVYRKTQLDKKEFGFNRCISGITKLFKRASNKTRQQLYREKKNKVLWIIYWLGKWSTHCVIVSETRPTAVLSEDCSNISFSIIKWN